MKLPNPGEIGFRVSDYIGKIVRAGIKFYSSLAEGVTLTDFLGLRFPLAEPTWIDNANTIVNQGRFAMQELTNEGIITPRITELTPIIPNGTLSLESGERFGISADIVSQDKDGNEFDRRSQSFGANEDDDLEAIFGKAIADLLRKIRDTNPQEADEREFSFLYAHFLGRVF